ncbi:hypothetical protein H4R33_002240 [Dimargaris cristalligena]|nr:hypothetical protein H4R33_002240 [Dimargaris cristalligena]
MIFGDVILIDPSLIDIKQNLTTSTIASSTMTFQLQDDDRVSQGGIMMAIDDLEKNRLTTVKYVVLVKQTNSIVGTTLPVDLLQAIDLFVVYQSDNSNRCWELGYNSQVPCLVIPYLQGIQLAAMLSTLYNQRLAWTDVTHQFPGWANLTIPTGALNATALTDPSLLRRLFVRIQVTPDDEVADPNNGTGQTLTIVAGAIASVGLLLKFEDFTSHSLIPEAKYVVLVEEINGKATYPPSASHLKQVNLFVVYQSGDNNQCRDIGVFANCPCVVIPYQQGTHLAALADALSDPQIPWAEVTDRYPDLVVVPDGGLANSTTTPPWSDSNLDRRLFVRARVMEHGQAVSTTATSNHTLAIVAGTVSGVVGLLLIVVGWCLFKTIRRQQSLRKTAPKQPRGYRQHTFLDMPPITTGSQIGLESVVDPDDIKISESYSMKTNH